MLADKFSFSQYIGLRILWITAKPVLLLVARGENKVDASDRTEARI